MIQPPYERLEGFGGVWANRGKLESKSGARERSPLEFLSGEMMRVTRLSKYFYLNILNIHVLSKLRCPLFEDLFAGDTGRAAPRGGECRAVGIWTQMDPSCRVEPIHVGQRELKTKK